MVQSIVEWIRALAADREKAQGMVEYALILVLVSVVAIVILGTLGTSVSSVFSQANAAL
ncbi:MAG: Flp family type IVb pilin [Chloroflexota bacterium]